MDADKFNALLAEMKNMSVEQLCRVFHATKNKVAVVGWYNTRGGVDDQLGENGHEPLTDKEWQKYQNFMDMLGSWPNESDHECVMDKIRPNWNEDKSED